MVIKEIKHDVNMYKTKNPTFICYACFKFFRDEACLTVTTNTMSFFR